MAIVTETTYKHEATGVEATPTLLDGKPIIVLNAGGFCEDISLDEARALVEVLQAALGDAPTPDSDGWIPWRGGECPVPPNTEVEYKVDFDLKVRSGKAGFFTWGGPASAITAYRIVKGSE